MAERRKDGQGIPSRGLELGEDPVELELMNEDSLVLTFTYDPEIHAVLRVTSQGGVAFAPPAALLPDKGHPVSRRTLNEWWQDRAIPATRDQIARLRDGLGGLSTMDVLEASRGLSLSDRYWVRLRGESVTWAEVNFFDNDFSGDLGLLTLGDSARLRDASSPSSSLGGDLMKAWVAGPDGSRVLIKAGRLPLNQEPYNEVIATRVHETLLEPGDHVPYRIVDHGGRPHSACENMLGAHEELVPAWSLRVSNPKRKDENELRFYVRLLTERAMDANVVRTGLAKMLACDYLIANSDRHWNNFGAMRDVRTLEYTRLAPIFDSGTCLWCRTPQLDTVVDMEFDQIPFKQYDKAPEAQLRLLEPKDLSWLDPSRLRKIPDIVGDGLRENPLMPKTRIDAIVHEVRRRCETLPSYMRTRLRTRR